MLTFPVSGDISQCLCSFSGECIYDVPTFNLGENHLFVAGFWTRVPGHLARGLDSMVGCARGCSLFFCD